MKLPKIITAYKMYLKEQETEPVFITAYEMYKKDIKRGLIRCDIQNQLNYMEVYK